MPDLKELISCEPDVFKNGAKIYRQYNCDSSWLTFENPKGEKRELISEYGGDLLLAERIGFIAWTEYEKFFLMVETPISGCCQPPNRILFDKNTGERKKDIGPIVFETENMDYPFVATFENGSLRFLNLDSGKTFVVKIPKNRLNNTIRYSSVMFPEHLFLENTFENGVATLIYSYQNSDNDEDWHEDQLVVDLKKHLK